MDLSKMYEDFLDLRVSDDIPAHKLGSFDYRPGRCELVELNKLHSWGKIEMAVKKLNTKLGPVLWYCPDASRSVMEVPIS